VFLRSIQMLNFPGAIGLCFFNSDLSILLTYTTCDLKEERYSGFPHAIFLAADCEQATAARNNY
jgi:hypothetical protein